MKHSYQKKYKNVFIRELMEMDIEQIRLWRNDSSNTRFLRKIPYITSQMQKEWFSSYLLNEKEMIFAIEEVENINGIVGSMALYNFTSTEAEFGKILIGNPIAHGKSVGRNAIEALKYVANDQLKLKRLYLHVYKDNIPAIVVYQKTGFVICDEHVGENGLLEYTMSVELHGGK